MQRIERATARWAEEMGTSGSEELNGDWKEEVEDEWEEEDYVKEEEENLYGVDPLQDLDFVTESVEGLEGAEPVGEWAQALQKGAWCDGDGEPRGWETTAEPFDIDVPRPSRRAGSAG